MSVHKKAAELLSLACNCYAVMGQVAVIKINNQDFTSLRQGRTLPSRESEKEKHREVGLYGQSEPNRELCKEVRCHLILINLHLGGLQATVMHLCVVGGGGLFCPCRSLLFTDCSA